MPLTVITFFGTKRSFFNWHTVWHTYSCGVPISFQKVWNFQTKINGHAGTQQPFVRVQIKTIILH